MERLTKFSELPFWRKAAIFSMLALALTMTMLAMPGMTLVVYASGGIGTIEQAILPHIRDLARLVRNAALVIGPMMLIIAIIVFMISNDQRKVDAAKSWGIRIFIAMIVIGGVTTILNWAIGMLGGTARVEEISSIYETINILV